MATAQAARALSGTMRCLADDDTHDDFKPRVKVAITDENIQEKLTEVCGLFAWLRVESVCLCHVTTNIALP